MLQKQSQNKNKIFHFFQTIRQKTIFIQTTYNNNVSRYHISTTSTSTSLFDLNASNVLVSLKKMLRSTNVKQSHTNENNCKWKLISKICKEFSCQVKAIRCPKQAKQRSTCCTFMMMLHKNCTSIVDECDWKHIHMQLLF